MKTISQKSDCDCGIVHNAKSNPLKRDPTRTTMLRRSFEKDMKRRLVQLKRAIKTIVVDRDVFHLNSNTGGNPFTANAPFFFDSYGLPRQSQLDNIIDGGDSEYIADTSALYEQQEPSKQLSAYKEWFQDQAGAGLLEVGEDGNGWNGKYITSTYKKALIRSYNDVRRVAGTSGDFQEGSRAEFLASSFGGPIGERQVQLLATRSFQQLVGVTAAMEQQMARTLSDGLAHGIGSRQLARDLNKNVTELGKKRALVIARTEMAHAYAEGQLDAFDRMNVKGVGVMAEWSTAGDDRVCPACYPLEGVVLEVREARGILPRHPNCRCAFVPAGLSLSGKPHQKIGKDRIDEAIDESVMAQARKGETIEEARKRLSWQGIGKNIPKDRRRTPNTAPTFEEEDEDGDFPVKEKKTDTYALPEKEGKEEEDYRIEHTAPTRSQLEDGTTAPMSQMDLLYPDDIYSDDGPRYYGAGSDPKMDKEIHKIIKDVRGDPDAMVTVYRGLPSDVDAEINAGDWVTPSREYAVEHTRRYDDDANVVELEVRAGDLFTEGNSLYEFGWDPETKPDPDGGTRVKKSDEETIRSPEVLRGMLDNLLEYGGFSYDPRKESGLESGMVVSTFPELELFEVVEAEWEDDEEFHAELLQTMQRYVEDREQTFKDNPDAHLGGWYDADNKRIYLDVVTQTETRAEAFALSMQYKQEAYFDLNTQEEIHVGARDESGKTDDTSDPQEGDKQGESDEVDKSVDEDRERKRKRREEIRAIHEKEEAEKEEDRKRKQQSEDVRVREVERKRKKRIQSAKDSLSPEEMEQMRKNAAYRQKVKEKEEEMEAAKIRDVFEEMRKDREEKIANETPKQKEKRLKEEAYHVARREAQLKKVEDDRLAAIKDRQDKREAALEKYRNRELYPDNEKPRKKPPETMTGPDSQDPSHPDHGKADPFAEKIWGLTGKGVRSAEQAGRIGAAVDKQIRLENPELAELRETMISRKKRMDTLKQDKVTLLAESREWLRENDTPEQTRLRAFNKVDADGKKVGLANHPDYEPDGGKEGVWDRDNRVRKAIDEEYKDVILKVNPFDEDEKRLEKSITENNVWIKENLNSYPQAYGKAAREMLPRVRAVGLQMGDLGFDEDTSSGEKYPMADRGEWYSNSDYKKRGGVITGMTPDEFLSRSSPLEMDEVTRDNVDDLKRIMRSGRGVDPLTIYEDDPTNVRSTDGRHRAIAAKELGIKQVPVVDFTGMVEPEPIVREILTQKDMAEMGGNYNLQHGMLMDIPVDMVSGLDPEPADWVDDDAEVKDFVSGQKIQRPIEVTFDADQNTFVMVDGNHRIKQAKMNGDLFIKAFAQSDDKSDYKKWMEMDPEDPDKSLPFFVDEKYIKDVIEEDYTKRKNSENDKSNERIIASLGRISEVVPKDHVRVVNEGYREFNTGLSERGHFDPNRTVVGLTSMDSQVGEDSETGFNRFRSNFAGEINTTSQIMISKADPDYKPVSDEYIDKHIEKEIERTSEADGNRGGKSAVEFYRSALEEAIERESTSKDIAKSDISDKRMLEIKRKIAEESIRLDRVSLHELYHSIEHATGDKLIRLQREYIYNKWVEQEDIEDAQLIDTKFFYPDAEVKRQGLTFAEQGWFRLDDDFPREYSGKMYLVTEDGKSWDPKKANLEKDEGQEGQHGLQKIWKDSTDFLVDTEDLRGEAYEVVTMGMESLLFGDVDMVDNDEYRDFILGILYGF